MAVHWVSSPWFFGAIPILLPGLAQPAPERAQSSLVRAVSPIEEIVEPPPLPPEETPPPPEDVPEPLVPDEPPLEEPPPETADAPPVDSDAVPPADLPPSRNRRPGRRVIGLGGESAPAAPAPRERLRPLPPPEPKRTEPVVTKRVSPEYPRRAVERDLEGKVLLLVEVRPDGSVGEIEVKESSGHAILDRAAMEAVRAWHFSPALVRGQPARSYVEVPFSFELQER